MREEPPVADMPRQGSITTSNKIVQFSHLSELRARLRGQKIVQCHGVFDVIHAGHLAYFEAAKKFGDVLVVTITADEYVNKGPGRPFFSQELRAEMLAALKKRIGEDRVSAFFKSPEDLRSHVLEALNRLDRERGSVADRSEAVLGRAGGGDAGVLARGARTAGQLRCDQW